MTGILAIVGSVIIGGAAAAATIVGVVSTQTAAPATSPTSVSSPVVEYGSN